MTLAYSSLMRYLVSYLSLQAFIILSRSFYLP
jgi:hypothetical protein